VADDNTVSYSVKELLAEIRDEMRRMLGLVEQKADRSEIATLHSRINTEAGRIDRIETHVEQEKRLKEEKDKAADRQTARRTWFWPTVASLLLVALTLVSVLLATVH
jgi:hypothetical protein